MFKYNTIHSYFLLEVLPSIFPICTSSWKSSPPFPHPYVLLEELSSLSPSVRSLGRALLPFPICTFSWKSSPPFPHLYVLLEELSSLSPSVRPLGNALLLPWPLLLLTSVWASCDRMAPEWNA